MLTLDQITLEQMEHDAKTLPFEEVVRFLAAELGQKLTAYLSGLKSDKVVSSWSQGKSKPRDNFVQTRLREAYLVARLIGEAYGAETTKAWLFGSNSRLDDEAPAYLIRNAHTPDDLRSLVSTARSFAGSTQ